MERDEVEAQADALLYRIIATDLYMHLRQFVGDPWRHGDDFLRLSTPARQRALFDRRWLDNVDVDVWHTTFVRVMEWTERHGYSLMSIFVLIHGNRPRLVRLLRNFTINTRRRLWRNQEDGGFEDFVTIDGETNEEVPPPKGFQPPDPHSWRYEYLAHDPWEGLDLRADLRRALAKLPPVDCALFIRHYAEDEPVLALAAECGLPVDTVKSKLKSAKRKLADFLNERPPKRRGRPNKNNLINGHPNGPISGLIIYIVPTHRGVADALSHRQNGAGSVVCAAPRSVTPEEDKHWPGWSMEKELSTDDPAWESCRQKVLKWREEGTHGQKLLWRSLHLGTIRESWTRHSVMRAFF